jgi:hypothetical protein
MLILASFCAVHAQRIPVVGVAAFETSGGGVTAADAANITNKVIAELNSWGTLSVVDPSGAEYVIRGTLTKSGANIVVSASTSNASTKKTLNEYSEQGNTVNNISITTLCAKAVEKVPLPNYLLGKWQSTINMPDGPVVCIMEFKSDRKTVEVERFDTWEHKQNNALRYEGYGKGDYSYAGYANRLITVNSQQIRIDAIISVNLELEETLPEQTKVDIRGISIVFNADKTSFQIVNGSLLCGRNFDGPSVYPAAVIGFSQFIKIR